MHESNQSLISKFYILSLDNFGLYILPQLSSKPVKPRTNLQSNFHQLSLEVTCFQTSLTRTYFVFKQF